jgi:hypothetical protein
MLSIYSDAMDNGVTNTVLLRKGFSLVDAAISAHAHHVYVMKQIRSRTHSGVCQPTQLHIRVHSFGLLSCQELRNAEKQSALCYGYTYIDMKLYYFKKVVKYLSSTNLHTQYFNLNFKIYKEIEDK